MLGGSAEGDRRKLLQLTIPPQQHRVESRHRLGGGLAAERQGVDMERPRKSYY